MTGRPSLARWPATRRALFVVVLAVTALAGPALAHGEESGTVHHESVAAALFLGGLLVAGAGVVLDLRSDLPRRSVDALVVGGVALAVLAVPVLWI